MEQPEEHRIFQEPEILKALRPGPADSPPPNCAICLGMCTNKCFTDCCLHQFCFNCLLEWSKIKAECPLCKQPFKSIIYNIKSNSEYEEHVIVNSVRENQDDLMEEYPSDFYLLPNGPRPQRHYEYRTTLTLEAGGEFTIQQLLRSHPRTNYIPFPGDRMLSINTHSIYNRRNVYNSDLWVDPQPDLTGRYRNCTPTFFRTNPAQVHRLEPWLNRELSALVSFSVVYMVHEQILDLLRIVPIQSSAFRSCLVPHLAANTDHFIHEFYNFVRSPFDMIGYDNYATYSRQRPPVYDLSDEDSDVLVVDSPANDDCVFVPPEVIVIESDDSDSDDVIIEEPVPPPIVDLLESSDTDIENRNSNQNVQSVVNEDTILEDVNRTESRSPQLPIKIRLKRNRSSVEIRKNYKRNERKNRKRDHRDDSSNSDISNSDFDDQIGVIYSTSFDDSTSTSSESDYSSSMDNRYKSERAKSTKRKKSSKYKKVTKDSKMKSKSSKYKIYKKPKVEEKSKESTGEKKKAKRSKKSKKQKKSKRSNDCSYKVKRMKKVKLENSETSSPQFNHGYSSSSDEEDIKYRPKRTLYQIKYEIENKDLQEKSNSSAQDLPAASSDSSLDEVNTNKTPTAPHTTTSTNDILNEAGPSCVPHLRSVVNVIVKNKDGEFWCSSSSPALNTASYRPDLLHRNPSELLSDSD